MNRKCRRHRGRKFRTFNPRATVIRLQFHTFNPRRQGFLVEVPPCVRLAPVLFGVAESPDGQSERVANCRLEGPTWARLYRLSLQCRGSWTGQTLKSSQTLPCTCMPRNGPNAWLSFRRARSIQLRVVKVQMRSRMETNCKAVSIAARRNMWIRRVTGSMPVPRQCRRGRRRAPPGRCARSPSGACRRSIPSPLVCPTGATPR